MPVDVEPYDWDDFLDWFSRQWKPGEHVAVVSPTGSGKTTFVVPILKRRRYVIAYDAKGGDSTLSKSRFRRLEGWPGIEKMAKMIEDDERHNRPSHYILGRKVRTPGDYGHIKEQISKALDDVFTMGGFTQYFDEHQLITDRRMMGLGSKVDRHLIASRDKAISCVTAYQAPSWTTPSSSRQATWIAMSHTADTDCIDTMARRMGRSKAELRGIVKALPDYTWIIGRRKSRSPYIITRPPKL
jgi:hypothetical protein